MSLYEDFTRTTSWGYYYYYYYYNISEFFIVFRGGERERERKKEKKVYIQYLEIKILPRMINGTGLLYTFFIGEDSLKDIDI